MSSFDQRTRVDTSAMLQPILEKLVIHFSITPPPTNLRERLINAGNDSSLVDRLLKDNDFCWMCIDDDVYFVWYKNLPFLFIEPEIIDDSGDDYHIDGLTLVSQSPAHCHPEYKHLTGIDVASAFDLKINVHKSRWIPKKTYDETYSDAIIAGTDVCSITPNGALS